MKTKTKGILMMIVGAIIVICTFLYPKPDYMIERDHDCVVLDKLQTSAGYKVQAKFILVLKDVKSNRVFDLDVTPATYSQAKRNDVLVFSLREYDIHQEENWNRNAILGLFIPCILGLIVIFWGWFLFPFDNDYF